MLLRRRGKKVADRQPGRWPRGACQPQAAAMLRKALRAEDLGAYRRLQRPARGVQQAAQDRGQAGQRAESRF